MWISNVRLVQQGRIQHCDIEIQQDRIREIYPVGSADRTQLFFDGQGRYLSHGFIDIHVHGGGGGDFMDGTEDAWRAATNLHLRHGTTGMVPTTLSASKEELLKAFSVFETCRKDPGNGAKVLGLHLEGPYFSPLQAGAQDPSQLRTPV